MSQFKNSVCRGFGERDDDLKKKNLQKNSLFIVVKRNDNKMRTVQLDHIVNHLALGTCARTIFYLPTFTFLLPIARKSVDI